jgi:hypothetical protein
MHCVKGFGFVLAQPFHLHSGNPESGFLDDRNDIAGLCVSDCVWFDDCEGSFHVISLSEFSRR